MKYIVLFLALSGCSNRAIEQKHVGDFKVEKLFTNDGVTVYRFHDWGYAHYFTSCGETISKVNCGKSCTRNENIK